MGDYSDACFDGLHPNCTVKEGADVRFIEGDQLATVVTTDHVSEMAVIRFRDDAELETCWQNLEVL